MIRGRTENYKVKRLQQTDENHQYLTQRKIPRGRSKTNHQLKNFNINKSSRTIEDLNSTKENYINKFLMDKSPHQLAQNDVN